MSRRETLRTPSSGARRCPGWPRRGKPARSSGIPGAYPYGISRRHFGGGTQWRAREWSHRAARYAGLGGPLGVPCRAGGAPPTPSSTARAAPRTRAAASWPASAATPEGLHRSHPPQRGGTTLGSPPGGATPSSLPRSSGCDAQTTVLFAPPRDGFSILGELCQRLIENTRENFHIPADFVVDQWTFGGAGSSNRVFLCLHDVWPMLRRQISAKIISTISKA